jgi:hypothetical protein
VFEEEGKMDLMLCFLNLFLVPFLSVSVWSRRRRETVTVSGTWIVRYAVFTVCNAIVSHVIVYGVRFLLHRQITEESSRYMVIAVLMAVLLPYLCDFFNLLFSHVGFHMESRRRDPEAPE